jgi:putative ABC transport system substrate-binding protein
VTARRRFITGIIAAAASVPLHAQTPAKRWRIGFLGANTPAAAGHLTAAFLGRLRELGLAEGRDFEIEYRWAAGQTDKYRQFASELVAARVDIIVTSGTAATVAAHSVTTSIPIVMAASGDLPKGIVASYAHPGGNVTGLSLAPEESAGKRLELIKQAVARLRGVAVLANPDANPREVSVVVSAAPTLGLAAHVFEFRRADDLSRITASPARADIGAIYLVSDPLVFVNRVAIAQFAIDQKLPMIGRLGEYAADGALMSYGPAFPEFFRRAAEYVEKIIKGEKAASLPIDQPTKYELVINMKTAKALGLAIPQQILLRADEIIQ